MCMVSTLQFLGWPTLLAQLSLSQVLDLRPWDALHRTPSKGMHIINHRKEMQL